MNKSKFEEAVKNKANANVQKKIDKFETIIRTAIRELFNVSYSLTEKYRREYLECYMALGKETYPRYLWEREEEKVMKELLALLDPVQQMLLAPGPSKDDFKPAAVEIEAVKT